MWKGWGIKSAKGGFGGGNLEEVTSMAWEGEHGGKSCKAYEHGPRGTGWTKRLIYIYMSTNRLRQTYSCMALGGWGGPGY